MKDELMSCKNNYVHEDKVQIAEHNMPSEENLISVTELFKVLGDPTRTKILSVLYNDELCVCDISKILNMTKSAISHQLRSLKEANLVKYRKEGKNVYYSLSDNCVKEIIEKGIIHTINKI